MSNSINFWSLERFELGTFISWSRWLTNLPPCFPCPVCQCYFPNSLLTPNYGTKNSPLGIFIWGQMKNSLYNTFFRVMIYKLCSVKYFWWTQKGCIIRVECIYISRPKKEKSQQLVFCTKKRNWMHPPKIDSKNLFKGKILKNKVSLVI